MATRLTPAFMPFLESDGDLLAGGKLYFYEVGTTTPKDTFSDDELTTANTNPVVLASDGKPAVDIWGFGDYKMVVKTSADVTLKTFDPLYEGGETSVVSTYAALSSVDTSNISDGTLIYVKGRAATGDGGQGRFYWDSDATDTSVTGLIIGSGTGRWKRAFNGPVMAEWLGDVETDIGACLNTALDAGYLHVRLPASTSYSIAQTTSVGVPAGATVEGAGQRSTVIDIQADIVPVVIEGSHATLKGFEASPSVAHTKNGIEGGNTAGTLTASRALIADLYLDGFGNDGIAILNGNLGTIRDVTSISNGNDGISFSTDTIDNNAWTFSGRVDLRANTRDGLHLAKGSSASDASAPKDHSGTIIVQSNGRYGLYSGTRSNVFTVYSESNTTNNVYLDEFGIGNLIFLTEEGGAAEFNFYSDGESLIWTNNENTNYRRAFVDPLRLMGGWFMSNANATGTLKLKHDVARVHDFYFDDTGNPQRIRFKNITGLADPDADTHTQPANIELLGHIYGGAITFADGDATPAVGLGRTFITANTSPTTITDFDSYPGDGAEIFVLINDANTTIDFTSNANLKGNGGADLTGSGKFIRCTVISDVWYCTVGTP